MNYDTFRELQGWGNTDILSNSERGGEDKWLHSMPWLWRTHVCAHTGHYTSSQTYMFNSETTTKCKCAVVLCRSERTLEIS